jgi:RNA polymerase sigma factor (sigma-70 family)
MAGGHIGSALQRLRGLLGAQCAGGPTDGDLLRRYVAQGDEAAFEALLRRHGPMVLGVCRRLLGTAQDVDDAFQATFLVLIRKAASIGDGERIGNWLYGVAYRVAVRARSRTARERARHKPMIDVVCDDAATDCVSKDVLALLDEEVSRLPAHYREAVVCCYLEGRTQEEAAHVLGWPKGTVSTRLNRARELLRNRLTRRGLTMTAGSVAVILGQTTAEGALPPSLVSAVLQTLGKALTNGPLPAGAAALADAVLRGVFVSRIKDAATVALALAIVTASGVVSFGPGRKSAEPGRPPALRTVSSPQARRDRPTPFPTVSRADFRGMAVVHSASEVSQANSNAAWDGARGQMGAAAVAGDSTVHVLTLTLTTHTSPSSPHAPDTTLSLVDPATGHVHASLKVAASEGWRLALLPSGQTLLATNSTDGEILAFDFLADHRSPREESDNPPVAGNAASVKVLRCWQVYPAGKGADVPSLPAKPRA